MMDRTDENTMPPDDASGPEMISEPEEETVEAVAARPLASRRRRMPSRWLGHVRRILVRIFFVIYVIGVLAFGYWYWTRPVRADQYRNALIVWDGLLDSFGLPVPKDERWGG
jgi:hypothetical protein